MHEYNVKNIIQETDKDIKLGEDCYDEKDEERVEHKRNIINITGDQFVYSLDGTNDSVLSEQFDYDRYFNLNKEIKKKQIKKTDE